METHARHRLRWSNLLLGSSFLVLALVGLLASLGCVGTPLPDPPSARAEAMIMVEVPPNSVRLEGADEAIHLGSEHEGGGTLRVTVPRTDARVETPVSATGAFAAELAGAETDTLYLELLDSERDVFLAAVAEVDGVVTVVADGGDRDGDLSPDAIDCAPDDPALAARECPASCATDADCAAAEMCVSGVCTCPGGGVELCRNLIDDDCDGVIDEAECI